MSAVMDLEKSSACILSTEQLERFRDRAAGYDASNEFFHEDFEELQQAGYLVQAVPEELGGMGFSLAEVGCQQRHLAYYAPADALAVNMHIYWTGVAADLWKSGDRSLEWLLREAAAGEVFAAGHAEHGIERNVFNSNTKAVPVDGGFCFSGHKSFGTMTPVWTRFGIHGLDDRDPENPRIVHGFLSRDADGYQIKEVWDVLGMRATKSEDTILDAAFVPDRYIGRIVPQGFGGADDFVLSMFAWALVGFSNVYIGLAQAAFDRICAEVGGKTTESLTRSKAWHPEVQRTVAESAVKLDAMIAHAERTAEDWSNGVDHGDLWPAKIVATKYHVVESAYQIVDQCLDLAGGFGFARVSGWERMFRDARMGRVHPANASLTREVVAKSHLGLDLDELPRWG